MRVAAETEGHRDLCAVADGQREVRCLVKAGVIAAQTCTEAQDSKGCCCPEALGALDGCEELAKLGPPKKGNGTIGEVEVDYAEQLDKVKVLRERAMQFKNLDGERAYAGPALAVILERRARSIGHLESAPASKLLDSPPSNTDVAKEPHSELPLTGENMAAARHCPMDGIKLRSDNHSGWCSSHIANQHLKVPLYLEALRKGIEVPSTLVPHLTKEQIKQAEKIKPGQVTQPAEESNKGKQGTTGRDKPSPRSKAQPKTASVGGNAKSAPKTGSAVETVRLGNYADLGGALIQRAEQYEADSKRLHDESLKLRAAAKILAGVKS